MLLSNDAIGGYFELELPEPKGHFYSGAKRFQSARAAFYALLLKGRPSKVWMPVYICDSILAPLKKAAIEIVFYSLNKDFSIKDNIKLQPNEWLFYVNYFGICCKQQQAILSEYGPDQVVFDHSQAFFQPALNCLATIYSPRKFFGVPDGGLLITKLDIDEPAEVDDVSIERSRHLLKRLGAKPESGYVDYQNAEKSLMDFLPKRMSALTDRVFSSIDFESARIKRNENFRFLHDMLANKNSISIDSSLIDGPMVYPFLSDTASLKSILISNKIFVATYWPECERIASNGSYEQELTRYLTPLPCDQRYGTECLERILHFLK